MNEKYIKKLIRLVEESEIESLEVSHWGRKVKIVQRLGSTSNGSGNSAVMQQATPAQPTVSAPPPAPAATQPPAGEPAAEDTGNLVAIKSPMVGTYYAAPAPDADPYISLNQKITAGQVVCIVEAMKLMNEIESEVSGRITKIMVENAQPVEYNQVLFYIDPQG